MNTRTLFTTALTAFLLSLNGVALATSPDTETPTQRPGGPSWMESGSPGMPFPEMHRLRQGGMLGSGMMNGGMMGMMNGGMMGGCPMMDPASGPNGKIMMQMHGEMMRAMGDIIMKYADKLQAPPSAQ